MILLSPFRQQKKLIKPDLVIRQLIIFFSSALVLSLLSAWHCIKKEAACRTKTRGKINMIFFLRVRQNAAIASSPHWYPMRACQGVFSPLEPSKGGGQNMGKSNRFIQKKFRLTEQENFILEEKLDSTGLSLQTYLVRAALGVPIFPLPPHLDDRLQLIYRSLRNIQGNINQIF